jgi:hypothetical protein
VAAAGQVLVGLDAGRLRHVLVSVAADAEIHEDRSSRGVQILERQLIDGTVTGRLLDGMCLEPHLHDPFDVVADGMLGRIEELPGAGDTACRAVLARWRERGRSALLGPERLAALLAELWHLRDIVGKDQRRRRLDCWRGPSGRPHDIERASIALEVRRIVGASFAGGVLPAGVRHLRYDIDLTGEQPAPMPAAEADAVLATMAAT